MFAAICLLAAVHAIGNGSSLAYIENADMIDMYGPGYSSPPFGKLAAAGAQEWRCTASRAENTNEWTTRIEDGHGGEAVIRDAIDPEYDVFVREIETGFEMRFEVEPLGEPRRYRFPGSLCVIAPVNTPYNARLLSNPKENRLYFFADGSAEILQDGIAVKPGRGRITIVFCHPDREDRSLAFAKERAGEVFARSAADWSVFFARGAAVRDSIPRDEPHRAEIVRSFDAVAALVRAQQARSGGVMAGRYYPMAYIRDQAGVLRGLLAMGYVDEAEKIFRFWLERFGRFGNLVTAEVMNGDEGRMIFNDEVEGPAYVAESAFLMEAARPGILAEALELLDWAVHVQLRQLHRGMTCFSGDETYVAGGMLPRAYLYHGSSESTARFILTAERYLAEFGPDEELSAAVFDARARFRENFVRDGATVANQPSRIEGLVPPRWQDGVCIRCSYGGGFGRLKSLEYDPSSGFHVCPDCFGKPIAGLPAPEEVRLPCVALQTMLLDGGFVTADEFARQAEFSRIDPDGATGYDFAVRLNALRRAGLDWRGALDEMLGARDEDGVWWEYYRDGRPYGCPCRPWESALDMEAILAAVLPAAD